MDVSEDVTACLRAQDHGHPPVICIALEGNGIRPSHMGNGWNEDGKMYTLNTVERHAVCYSIGAMNSEGMLSDNPKSGYHETDVARTLDTNGSNPAGYQGRDVVICFKERGGSGHGGKGIMTSDNKTFSLPSFPENKICYAIENHPCDSRVTVDENGIVQTLNARMGTGGATRQ